MYKKITGKVTEFSKRYGPPRYRHRQQRLAFGGWRDDLYFEEWRLGFITIPKAANTSLKYSLMEALPKERRDQMLAKIQITGDRQAIHGAFRDSVYATTYDKLTCLDTDHILVTTRRPEARLVSFYFDKVIGDGWPPEMQAEVAKMYGIDKNSSFDDFIERLVDTPDEEAELHFRSIHKIIGSRVLADPRLLLIRTENFNVEFRRAFAEIGLPLTSPRKENAMADSRVRIHNQ